MAVTVPSEEKVYTTVYENFKGVDYTNDPSNVWKRRSPDGLNMLPDLDGRPYKRYGWKVEIPASAFGNNVEPGRLYHFTLNGLEYIMIFNNNGVFYMRPDKSGVTKCQLKTGSVISDFPPQVGGEDLQADSNRAFYFEGNGLAGFYTFVGNELFRFDGEYYQRVEPYVPTIIEGASPSGAGTSAEDINILTEKRMVSYMGDGTSTQYSLPENVDPDSVVAEVYDTDDFEWKPATVSDIRNNVVELDTAPASSTKDNVRITYEPSGGGINYSVDSNYVSDEYSITVTRTETTTRKKTVTTVTAKKSGMGSTTTQTEVWPMFPDSTADESTSVEVPVPNNFGTITVQDNLTETWEASGSRVLATKGSYSDSVTLHSPASANIAKTYGEATTNTTGWVKVGTTTKTGEKTIRKTVTYKQTKTVTYTKTFNVRVAYPRYEILGSNTYTGESRTAFMTCRKALGYGNGLYNQMFLSSAVAEGYQTRAWFSAVNDPSYWPDLNYIEVGSDDTDVVGMIKIGSYMGFVKAGSGTDSSVYLAYPVTFDEKDTFAVKQGVNGIGAVSAGAFNILEGEPLFLSNDGVIGVEVSDEETDRHARNRSWFINGKLTKENLKSAVSFIHDGMYWLAVDGRCYVLDGSQKNSWANEKTNMQYEAYYLENIPAICFSGMNNRLYFSDRYGNICRFKDSFDAQPFTDEYKAEQSDYIDNLVNTSFEDIDISALDVIYINGFNAVPEDGTVLHGSQFALNKLDDVPATVVYDPEQLTVGKTVVLGVRTGTYTQDIYIYTLTSADKEADEYVITKGVPIPARWSTIADDDGAVHFFKNLQKKGCVVSLLPMPVTGVTVSLKADEKDPVEIGQVEFNGGTLPHEFYIKKKLKKYKRLQIICENNDPYSGFGLDQIIKSYTMGNYSKNKG